MPCLCYCSITPIEPVSSARHRTFLLLLRCMAFTAQQLCPVGSSIGTKFQEDQYSPAHRNRSMPKKSGAGTPRVQRYLPPPRLRERWTDQRAPRPPCPQDPDHHDEGSAKVAPRLASSCASHASPRTRHLISTSGAIRAAASIIKRGNYPDRRIRDDPRSCARRLCGRCTSQRSCRIQK